MKNFTHAHYAANIVPYTKDELFTDTAISFIRNLYINDHNITGIIYKSGGEEKEYSQCNIAEENWAKFRNEKVTPEKKRCTVNHCACSTYKST